MENWTLDSNALLEANRYFKLSDGRLGDLMVLCERLQTDAALHALAGAYHKAFFHTDEETNETARRLREETEPALGGRWGALAALIMISGLPHMLEAYRKRGIPGEALVDSLRDMTIWMDEYEAQTGVTGLGEACWLAQSLRGVLFRIGRFQFFNSTFEEPIAVAERLGGGSPAAFFTVPVRMRGDGQADGANGVFDEERGWLTSFRANEAEIAGTPLHPGGYALNRELRLPAGEWELTVRPGVSMLDIHIPKDGKMELDACRDSILNALRFFETYFPEKPVSVIHLCTWFLDPQLQRLLPPESNIVRLQREFYLLPVPGADDRMCLERVFGSADIDIESAPEDSSLRRAVKRFMLGGGRMRESRGLILPRDLKNFGNAQYQRSAFPLPVGFQ